MKVCLLEFWGLGDAVMMTSILQALRENKCSVTVVCKPATAVLLRPTYPEIEYLGFDPPWTAFRGKYRLWCWPWVTIFSLVFTLRKREFTDIASVRKDPRDHLFMALVGGLRRIGFPRGRSRLLLSDALPVPSEPRHIVEDWHALQERILPGSLCFPPFLEAFAYGAVGIRHSSGLPVLTLHCGARIPVRRWSTASFREILIRLRKQFSFHLRLLPDLDGYGSDLADLADEVLGNLSLPEMVSALADSTAVLCNDSAPAHIAAATGRPVAVVFGPTHPTRFRPFGAAHHVVIRDICAYRPCLDYCRFPEPYCLTKLTAPVVWPELRDFFARAGFAPLERSDLSEPPSLPSRHKSTDT